jgi:hypothetical protein
VALRGRDRTADAPLTLPRTLSIASSGRPFWPLANMPFPEMPLDMSPSSLTIGLCAPTLVRISQNAGQQTEGEILESACRVFFLIVRVGEVNEKHKFMYVRSIGSPRIRKKITDLGKTN